MDYTTNYQLPIWAESDRILMEDFNDSYQKLEDALTEHGESLAGKGDCQIYTTSYVGTGTFTYQNRTQLTFPATPRAVFITGSGDIFLAFCPGTRAQLLFSDETASCGNLLWTETSLSFYDASAARNQMNHKGRTYQVVALLDAGA